MSLLIDSCINKQVQRPPILPARKSARKPIRDPWFVKHSTPIVLSTIAAMVIFPPLQILAVGYAGYMAYHMYRTGKL